MLLDAPCSGNFCVEQNFFTQRTPADFQGRAKTQKALLKTARRVLRPGGTLVYSTCSLEPEEDELIIDWFLKEYDDMSVQPLVTDVGDNGFTTVFGTELDPSIAKTKRFWPHKTNTEGFFVAKLRKSSETFE